MPTNPHIYGMIAEVLPVPHESTPANTKPIPNPALRAKHRATEAEKRQIRRDYIAGLGTIKALATKYGFPVDTVQFWSEGEGWVKLRARANQADIAQSIPPEPAPSPISPIPGQPADHLPKLAVLEKQLARIDELLEEAKDPKTWHMFSTAKDKLLGKWMDLSGIPKPGSRRPGRESSRRPSAPLGPVEDSPTA